MSWARLDDQMPDNEKVANLSDTAFRCYVTAICYSARMLTDGIVPVRKANELAGRKSKAVLSELVPLLWHEPGDYCESEHCSHLKALPPGNYLVHNYLKYNPTREKVLADREAKSRAGQKGASNRWRQSLRAL